VIEMDSTGGYVPFARNAFASKLANAARAAALQEESLRRRLAKNQNLWSLAQEAEKSGDLRVAARMYERVALSRPRTNVTAAAQQRLTQIQAAAQSKFDRMEDRLASLARKGKAKGKAHSDSQNVPYGLRSVPSASQIAQADVDEVTRLFAELDNLILEYAGVDSIENKFQQRVDRLRRQEPFTAVLQEPAASQLWQLGQTHEQQQQLCCAFLAYEQAAKLAPAPSGEKAKARARELQETNQSLVAEVRACLALQLCHEKYRRAMALKETLPERAREYLAEIIERAAPDTTVHKAAREQIAMLR
jgi:hypothetical protein